MDTEGEGLPGISSELVEEENEAEARGNRRWESSEEEDEAEDLNEDDIEHRRMIARQKALIKQQEEVLVSNQCFVS